ncbi:hypothetical protein PRIPAC_87759 [Pristionchus pacificus]|uniref:Uncharacterized protein n=1 Tax=Pristionchus pacificus TaxID=54126 RepID=A0A454XQD9_PRIPA|nr:hypothetical protein PRIPAC_87759 [Pristionchus pacificus]|eukprot:PDM82041.1 hypothetical protein PRIPAC_36434 [Pristionchus pacificus]
MCSKILIVLLILAIAAVHVDCQDRVLDGTRVEACDVTCTRIQRERDECCRAHGYRRGNMAGICAVRQIAFCRK